MVELIAFAGRRIKIRVAAQTLVHHPAEQIVDRLIERFSHDVPTCHFQAAHHAHERHIGTQREAGSIAFAPKGFDPHGITAQQAPSEQIFNHCRNDFGTESGGVDFADSFNSAGGTKF